MSFALPPSRYLPGKTPRHEEAVFQPVMADLAQYDTAEQAAASAAWPYALSLLEQQYYWEAHEVLEAVWMLARPNSPEFFLLQGLIQTANSGLKRRMGNALVSEKLAIRAREHVELAYRNRPLSGVMGLARIQSLEIVEKHARG